MITIKNFLESSNAKLTSGRFWIIAIPYIWLAVFFLLPFLIVFRVSFSDEVLALPPYTDILQWGEGLTLKIILKFQSYRNLIDDAIYVQSYLTSIMFAALTTLITLVVGYPMAMGIVRLNPRMQIGVLLLIMMPFWTSFLIRIYAWLNLLTPFGLINTGLLKIGLISEPLPLLFNHTAVLIGMVYCYLPFMIFPCYVVLEKIDDALREAASDLGGRPLTIFFRIILPLSMPGVLTGALLVFIPCVGEFVIPEILGGSDNILIGRLVWNEFFINRSWPTAAALAFTLLVVVFIPIYGLQRLQTTLSKKLED